MLHCIDLLIDVPFRFRLEIVDSLRNWWTSDWLPLPMLPDEDFSFYKTGAKKNAPLVYDIDRAIYFWRLGYTTNGGFPVSFPLQIVLIIVRKKTTERWTCHVFQRWWMKRGFSFVLLTHKMNCRQPNLMCEPWVNKAVPSQPLPPAPPAEFVPEALVTLLMAALLMRQPHREP